MIILLSLNRILLFIHAQLRLGVIDLFGIDFIFKLCPQEKIHSSEAWKTDKEFCETFSSSQYVWKTLIRTYDDSSAQALSKIRFVILTKDLPNVR